MSLFGLLKRSKSAPDNIITPILRDLPPPPDLSLDLEETADPVIVPVSPDQVRQMLFDAIATGDEVRLKRLCEEHKDYIREYADTWMIVPDSLMANPAAAEWYKQGLQQLTRFVSDSDVAAAEDVAARTEIDV